VEAHQGRGGLRPAVIVVLVGVLALVGLATGPLAAQGSSAKQRSRTHAQTGARHRPRRAHPRHRPKAHRRKAHRRKARHPARRPTGASPVASPPAGPPTLFDGVFWDGDTVASGEVKDASLCGVAGPCYTYPLDLPTGGARLRVALDTPERTNTFNVDLIDPSGSVATSFGTSNSFDAEGFVMHPAAGRWTVRVMPADVSHGSFRMRAKLERRVPVKPSGHVALLPELRADPPYEFTMIAPANPLNGLYPPDTVNPPLDVAGVHPLSCTVDEMAPNSGPGADIVQGGAATRCLRFTSGPMNVGIGVYEMHFTYAQDIVNGQIASPVATGPLFQTIHYGDGTTSTRRAGTYSFHVTHAHFHDNHILDYQLFRVEAGNRLVKAGAGTKSGFCPANQLFGEWRSFTQDAPDGLIGSGDTGTGNCQNPADGVLGLSPGWGDVYRWQRPGMYVEFGTQPDGLYVVRITIDAGHEVLESSYANNSAYALVKVQGDHVQEIERGQGLSPWDPHKIVFTGAGPASRD
jgi:hypothetical protein